MNKSETITNLAEMSGAKGIEKLRKARELCGNAIEYLRRADLKDDTIEDIQKAIWYINREIERRLK
jgi:hypothetical protein